MLFYFLHGDIRRYLDLETMAVVFLPISLSLFLSFLFLSSSHGHLFMHVFYGIKWRGFSFSFLSDVFEKEEKGNVDG